MRYYREPNGDYLAVDESSAPYYRAHLGKTLYEGRATAIEGLITSVCTTAVSPEFLSECSRVRRAVVPAPWRRAING